MEVMVEPLLILKLFKEIIFLERLKTSMYSASGNAIFGFGLGDTSVIMISFCSAA